MQIFGGGEFEANDILNIPNLENANNLHDSRVLAFRESISRLRNSSVKINYLV